MDHYALLGLDRTCTAEQIKTQYRLLARANHPDVTDGDKESANQRMRDLNEAYDVLSDPALRRQYDARLNAAGSNSPAGDWNTDHRPTSPGSDQRPASYTYVWDKQPSYWAAGLPMNWVIRVAIMFACFVLLPKLEHRTNVDSQSAQVATERHQELADELQATNPQVQSQISGASAAQQILFRELSDQSTMMDPDRRARIVRFSADLESLRRLSTQMTADAAELRQTPAAVTDAEDNRINTEMVDAMHLSDQVGSEVSSLSPPNQVSPGERWIAPNAR